MGDRVQYIIASFSWFEHRGIILPKGYMGIVIDTGRFKIGDGKTKWDELNYAM